MSAVWLRLLRWVLGALLRRVVQSHVTSVQGTAVLILEQTEILSADALARLDDRLIWAVGSPLAGLPVRVVLLPHGVRFVSIVDLSERKTNPSPAAESAVQGR